MSTLTGRHPRHRACRGDSWIIVLAATSLVVCPRSVKAQGEQAKVVLVHGLQESGGIWGSIISDLQSSGFNISIMQPAPTLISEAHLTSQASELIGAVQNASIAWPDVIAVGHSNGGLVARAVAPSFGSGWGPRGIITVGTPNSGAPIIPQIPYIASFGDDVLNGMDFLAYAVGERMSSEHEYWLEAWFGEQLSAFAQNIVQPLISDAVYTAVGVYLYNNYEAIEDDTPGSSFLYALNEQNGIADQNVPARIGIRVHAPDSYSGGPWVMFASQSEALDAGYHLHYWGFQLFDLANDADRDAEGAWEDDDWQTYDADLDVEDAASWVGSDLLSFENQWCYWVGGGQCGASDGLIPDGNQHYPWSGGEDDSGIQSSQYGHSNEQYDANVIGEIRRQVHRTLQLWFGQP